MPGSLRPTLRVALGIALLAMLSITGAAIAQTAPDVNIPDENVRAEVAKAFASGDYSLAAAALERQIVAEPGNFVPRYNLACARAMLNDVPGGVAALVDSIEHGFVDRRHLESDGYLRRVREDPAIQRLMSRWSEVLDRHRDANLASAQEMFKKGYTHVRDDSLRIDYLSAFGETPLAKARDEVRRVADFTQKSLIPDLFDAETSELDAWVVVVLPTRTDFQAWASSKYGADARTLSAAIGGAYDHDLKRLVCQDIGSSLRHEFMHVLHWRHCVRLGQVHAYWVQEGLGCLVEDMDPVTTGNLNGDVVPVPSWRTNIAKRMERTGGLVPLHEFCSMTPPRFMSARPLAMYSQARSLMMYLHSTSQLEPWYSAYASTFTRDQSGYDALTRITERDKPTLMKEYRAYVRSLPMVPEEILDGMASLGVAIEGGSGEGPVIAEVVRRRTDGVLGLIKGDVVTSVDGRPTRDIAELVRVLSSLRPGDAVDVEYRRGTRYGTASVTLVAKRSE